MSDHSALPQSEIRASVEVVYDAIAGLVAARDTRGLSAFGTLALHVARSARENLLRTASHPWLLLPLTVGDALGVRRDASTQIAAGFELARLAAGVLDQCVDGDTDGALWTKIGMGQAVTVASGLTALALLAIDVLPQHGISSESAAQVQRAFNQTWLRMCEGQQAELSTAEHDNFLEDRYWAVAGAKSGAFFELGSVAPALLSECEDPTVVEALRDFGFQTGLMIQLANDLQGLLALNGKRDVGKRHTLPIIYAHAMLDEAERINLERLLALAANDATAADQCRAIIEQSGATEYSLVRMQLAHDRALRCLAPLADPARLTDLLDAWFPLASDPPSCHNAPRG